METSIIDMAHVMSWGGEKEVVVTFAWVTLSFYLFFLVLMGIFQRRVVAPGPIPGQVLVVLLIAFLAQL